MTTKVNERALVLEMLLAVNEEGQYSHLVLRDVLDKYQYLGKQERAFLTRLMEGTLERQLTLDYVIDQFSKTRVKKMKPLIRNLMRMSVYQIMYMDSVPDSAVCNEAVKLARKRGFSGLSGFVNGVLRSVARGWRSSLPESERYIFDAGMDRGHMDRKLWRGKDPSDSGGTYRRKSADDPYQSFRCDTGRTRKQT